MCRRRNHLTGGDIQRPISLTLSALTVGRMEAQSSGLYLNLMVIFVFFYFYAVVISLRIRTPFDRGNRRSSISYNVYSSPRLSWQLHEQLQVQQKILSQQWRSRAPLFFSSGSLTLAGSLRLAPLDASGSAPSCTVLRESEKEIVKEINNEGYEEVVLFNDTSILDSGIDSKPLSSAFLEKAKISVSFPGAKPLKSSKLNTQASADIQTSISDLAINSACSTTGIKVNQDGCSIREESITGTAYKPSFVQKIGGWITRGLKTSTPEKRPSVTCIQQAPQSRMGDQHESFLQSHDGEVEINISEWQASCGGNALACIFLCVF